MQKWFNQEQERWKYANWWLFGLIMAVLVLTFVSYFIKKTTMYQRHKKTFDISSIVVRILLVLLFLGLWFFGYLEK